MRRTLFSKAAGALAEALRQASSRVGSLVVLLAFFAPSAAWAQQTIDRCEVLGKLQDKNACQLDLVQPSDLGVYVKVLFNPKTSLDADTVEFFFPGHPPGDLSQDRPWSVFLATKSGTPVDKLLEMSGDWTIEDANGAKSLVLTQDGRAVFKFEYPLIYGLPLL